MVFFQRIKNFVEKLRRLSDDQKKVIIFTVVGVVALVMGFFWVRSLPYYFEKIGEGLNSSFGEEGSSFDFLGGASDGFSGKLEKAGGAISGLKDYLSDEQMSKLLAAEDEISREEWKTYKNSRYGYNVQYPNEWIIDDFNPSAVKIFQFSPGRADVLEKEAPGFYVNAEETEKGSSAEEGIKKKIGEKADFFIREKAMMGGAEGLLICKDSKCDPLEIFIARENRLYNFVFKTDSKSDQIRQGIIFQRIINNFKFIK